MSAAIPLRLYPVRGRTPIYALLVLALVIWFCMMLASLSKAHGAPTGIMILLGISSMLMAVLSAFQMRGLTRARELVRNQQIPEALWQAWMRAGMAEAFLCWSFLGAIMTGLLASPSSTMPWPAAFALVSSFGVLGALAHQSPLPIKLGTLAKATVAALLMSALSFTGQLLAWLVALPTPALMLLALSWPLLGVVLMLRWRTSLGPARLSREKSRRGWTARLDSELRRYSPLFSGKSSLAWAQGRQATTKARLFWLVNSLISIHIYFSSFSPLGWQQEPDARHLLSLGALCLFMTYGMIARDLHWRSLLMPGGWRKGRIASDIFASTLQIQCAGIAVAAVIYLLSERLFKGLDFWTSLEVVAGHSLLVFELALAVSVALVICALPHSAAVTVVLYALVAICWAYVRFGVGYAALSRWPAGGMLYAALMAAATYAILRLANRMWTTEKLMACARAG